MTEGAVNKVLYNVDQRADTTEAEKKTARDNIGAVGLSDIEPVMDERYKLLQQPIEATFASFAVIDRYSQTSNGVVDIHCSYICPATESTNGLMSAGDKTKLDGIQYGAEVNVQSDWNQSDNTADDFIKNKPDLSQYATQQDLSGKQDVLTAGDNITITNNVISATAAPQQQADWTEDDNTSVSYIQNKPNLATVATTGEYSDLLHVPDLTQYKTKQSVVGESFAANAIIDRFDQDANGVASIHCSYLSTATTTADGLMSSSDKSKLDGITAGAEPNVQANWAENDNTLDSYIQNKPNLSTVATTGEYSDLLHVPDLTQYKTKQSVIAETFAANAVIDRLDQTANGEVSVHCSYLSTATTSADGLMSSSDKSKLDGIASGAEVNVQANWTESDSSSDSYIQNKPSNLVQDANYVHTDNNFTTAEKTKLGGIEAGAEVNVQANWNETDSSSDAYIQNKPQNLVQDANYVHTDNNFTSAEKTKLAGIEAGAEVNVQSDWNQTDTSADDYIKNKPAIPEIPPMKELVAGSGIGLVETEFDVTISATSQTDNNFTDAYKTKLDGIAAGAEVNVQANWTESNSSSDAFIKNKPNLATVATSGDYDDLQNKPTLQVLTAGNGIDITGDEVSVLAGTNLGFEGTPSVKQLSSPVARLPGDTYVYPTLGQLNADTVALLKDGQLEITPLLPYTGTANSAGVHFAICQLTDTINSTNIPNRNGYWLIADSTVNSATSDSYSVAADTPITADFSTLHSSSNTTWSTVEADPTSFYLVIISWSTVYGIRDSVAYASSAATSSSQTAPVSEHDYIDTDHLRLYANVPASTQVVTMTATVPPVETPVNKLTIVDNGRVMGDTSNIGLIAPYGLQADEGKVLTHHYSGSPGICWASWDPAPEAHTVGFEDIVITTIP